MERTWSSAVQQESKWCPPVGTRPGPRQVAVLVRGQVGGAQLGACLEPTAPRLDHRAQGPLLEVAMVQICCCMVALA